jgi:hypothetical protein
MLQYPGDHAGFINSSYYWQWVAVHCSGRLACVENSTVLTWKDPGPGDGEAEGVHVHVLEELHILLQTVSIWSVPLVDGRTVPFS